MGKSLLLLLALALMGCEKGYDEAQKLIRHDRLAVIARLGQLSSSQEEQIKLAKTLPEYERFVSRFDSLLAIEPSIRFWDDSLARRDSTFYGTILLMRMSDHFFYSDTTAAVYAFFDALPWFEGTNLSIQTDHARRFASVLGDAITATHSPNMARLSYQAFERAKRLASGYGDPQYIHLADSSYKAVARRVLTMPDSVRSAFGPPPDRPARVPWVLATLAAAFIAASVASCWRPLCTTA